MGSIKSDKDRIYSSQFLSALPAKSIHPHQAVSPLTSLTIFNSLTGEKLTANSYAFNSLDSLKEYIASCFNIPSNMLFILTPFGIKLKFSMILHDQINEIYVFDRGCFNVGDNEQMKKEFLDRLNKNESHGLLKPAESPLLSYQKNLDKDNYRSNINALKRNSGWAAAILSDFKKSRDSNFQAEEDDSVEVILRSLNVLILYLRLSSDTLKKNLEGSSEYFHSIQKNTILPSWKDHYNDLAKVSFKISGQELKLTNLIPRDTLNKTAKELSSVSKEVEISLERAQLKLNQEIINENQKLESNYRFLQEKHDSSSLMSSPSAIAPQAEDLGASQLLKLQSLVQELIEDANDLPPSSSELSSTDIEFVEECFNKALNIIIPEITLLSNDLYSKHMALTKSKKMLQQNLFGFIFNKVAQIQICLINTQKLLLNDLQPRLRKLQSLEMKLSIVIDLPLVFGMFLIFKYKNFKWFQNVKKISYKTNEILQMLQHMETSSRIKWIQKFLGNGNFDLGSVHNLNDSFNGKINGVIDQYQDFLSGINKDDIVNENMPVIQLSFNMKQQDSQKIVIDANSSNNKNNAALNKFIHSLSGDDNSSAAQHSIWNKLQVTNVGDIEKYVEQLKACHTDDSTIQRLEKHILDLSLDSDATFDVHDANYMKLYKKFLKNYQLEGFKFEFGNEVSHKNNSPRNKKDEDIIKGYESRVKKLENLLHQQQFLQFNQEFKPRMVSTNSANNDDSTPTGSATTTTTAGALQIELPPNRTFNSSGQEAHEKSISPPPATTVTSTPAPAPAPAASQEDTADKVALLKEIEELKSKLSKSEDEKEALKLENENLKLKLDNDKVEFDQEKQNWRQDYDEINAMKADLIENMASLRKDHEEESASQLQQITKLKFDIETLQKTEEESQHREYKMMDQINDMTFVIESLCNVIDSMYLKLKEMSKKIFIDLSNFCVVLESIGLLLVQDDQDVWKIVRVKGLKKTKEKDLKAINSEIVTNVEKNLYWTDLSMDHETMSVKDMASTSMEQHPDQEDQEHDHDHEQEDHSITELDIHSKELIHKFHNELFEANYKTFMDSFQIDDEYLTQSIIKRFKDVENLARKYQKDIVTADKRNVEKLTHLQDTKISIRDFIVGDLVLFLPTTDEFITSLNNSKQWAAFNIGAPHYFLNNSDGMIDLSTREWLVARVTAIKEYKITEENAENNNENPFKLSVGVSWFSVDARPDLD